MGTWTIMGTFGWYSFTVEYRRRSNHWTCHSIGGDDHTTPTVQYTKALVRVEVLEHKVV